MVIGIDIRPLMHGKTSGIEVYIRSLLKELLKDKKNTYVLYYNAWEKPKASMNFEGARTVSSRIPNKIFYLTNRLFKWPKIDRIIKKKTGKQIDLLFMPDPRPCSVSKDVKLVVTFHDLSFIRCKKFFSAKSKTKYILMNPRKLAKKADHLIAVSNFTKQELEELFSIPSHKITVIHEGAGDYLKKVTSSEKIDAVRKKYNLPKRFFLSLSHLEPRKNLHYLIESYQQFKKNSSRPIDLVIAGLPDPAIFQTLNLPKDKNILYPGFIENNDKAALFSLAEAFIYPSLYEGFGLPVLEAMQCETPVICSKGSSLTEIGDNAVIFIDPQNPETLAKEFSNVLESKTREALQKAMKSHIQKFSWTKCARETLSVFHKCHAEPACPPWRVKALSCKNRKHNSLNSSQVSEQQSQSHNQAAKL